MRIATAFFLLVMTVLCVFCLAGGLVNEAWDLHEDNDALIKQINELKAQVNDLLTQLANMTTLYNKEKENNNTCQVEKTNLIEKVQWLESENKAWMAAAKSFNQPTLYLPEISESTMLTGGALCVTVTILGFSALLKFSMKIQEKAPATQKHGRRGQKTITMDLQTYVEFQQYLQTRRK